MSYRLLKVCPDWLKGQYPQIRISGKWLEKHGFNIDKHVLLEARDGELVLRAVTVEAVEKD